MSTPKYLIDTSVWIPSLRRDGPESVVSQVRALVANNQALTSGIIKAELLQGTKTQEEFALLQRRLGALPLAELDHSDWSRVAELSFLLRRKGAAVPLIDVIIWVQAERNDCIVVHADDHFAQMSRVTGVAVLSLASEVKKKAP